MESAGPKSEVLNNIYELTRAGYMSRVANEQMSVAPAVVGEAAVWGPQAVEAASMTPVVAPSPTVLRTVEPQAPVTLTPANGEADIVSLEQKRQERTARRVGRVLLATVAAAAGVLTFAIVGSRNHSPSADALAAQTKTSVEAEGEGGGSDPSEAPSTSEASTSTTNVLSSTTTLQPTPECAVDTAKVTYFADQARPGSNHFGPEGVKTNPQESFNNLISRGTADPSLVAGTNSYIDHILTGSEIDSPDAFDAKIKEYASNPTSWKAACDKLNNSLKDGEATFVTQSGDYHTLFAISKARDGRPEIRQSKENMTGKVLLKIVLKGKGGESKEVFFKIDCGFQPVQLGKFEGVKEIPRKDTPAPKSPETTATTKDKKKDTTTSSTSSSSTIPKSTTSSSTSSSTTTPPPTTPKTVPTSSTTVTTRPSTTTTKPSTTTTKPSTTTTRPNPSTTVTTRPTSSTSTPPPTPPKPAAPPVTPKPGPVTTVEKPKPQPEPTPSTRPRTTTSAAPHASSSTSIKIG